jgi:hypothetical protein
VKKEGKPKKPRVVKPVLTSEHPLEFICGISHKLMADPVGVRGWFWLGVGGVWACGWM